MLFLPLCQLKRGNVLVGVFTKNLRPRYRAMFDLAANLLFLVLTATLAVQLGHGTADKFRDQDTTMVLRIPEGWAYAAALASVWLLVLATAYTVLRSALEIARRPGDRPAARRRALDPCPISPPGLASFGILLALLAVRVPIGVAMLAVGAGGFIWIQGLAPLLSFLKTTPFETFASYSFSVIPLFLLMGNVASSTGLSARLFRGANALLGNLRGGMAMAAVGACAAFGTICGSSLATAATMGQVALPEMRKYGYSGALATGTLAAGGTLGILVPPSIPLVVYAILTEQNIAKLFLAAFVPAALAIIGFFHRDPAVTLLVRPDAAPATDKAAPRRVRLRHIAETWPVVGIFLVVFVGMNGDFFVGRSLFTPTEGAAIGALLATIAALHDRRHALAQRVRLRCWRRPSNPA